LWILTVSDPHTDMIQTLLPYTTRCESDSRRIKILLPPPSECGQNQLHAIPVMHKKVFTFSKIVCQKITRWARLKKLRGTVPVLVPVYKGLKYKGTVQGMLYRYYRNVRQCGRSRSGIRCFFTGYPKDSGSGSRLEIQFELIKSIPISYGFTLQK
jgi:hypothetical protein